MKKNQNNNPFYGEKELLQMYQLLSSVTNIATNQLNSLLDNAMQKAKTSKELMSLFFIIFFSIGDIDRHHHIFINRVPSGGSANRKVFRKMLFWLFNKNREYFYSLMPIIIEYTVVENIFYWQLRTKKSKILDIEQIPVDPAIVGKFIGKILKNPKNSQMFPIWAKYLSRSRFSTRKNKSTGLRRALKPETKERMQFKKELIESICEEMGWKAETNKLGHQVFTEFNKWRKRYNRNNEAVVFSEQIIRKMDKLKFFQWLDSLPSGARFRVRNRLIDNDTKVSKDKWKSDRGDNLGNWYLQWEEQKLQAQKELINLKEDLLQTGKADMAKIAKLEKMSKVTTGGDNLVSLLKDILSNENKINEVSVNALLAKINLEIPILIVLDQSGSMGNRSAEGYTSRNISQLVATLLLQKNPHPEGREYMIGFGSEAVVYGSGAVKIEGKIRINRFIEGKPQYVNWVDRKDSFIENFQKIKTITNINKGATHLNSVSTMLAEWIKKDDTNQRIEILQNYPVILIISDGDLNNESSAKESMRKFQQEMLDIGWDGVIVLWDILDQTKARESKFEGLENVVHYTGININILNSIFTQLSDIESIDIYTPLNALIKNPRYFPVQHAVANL